MDTNEDTSRLVAALEKLGYVKVVTAEEKEKQIRLLCRVTDKRSWVALLERLLNGVSGWKPHICQQYFLKDGAMVYGWNFIINAEDPPAICRALCSFLTVAPTVEVDTFPLRGALRAPAGAVFNPQAPGPTRGGASHKGVFPVGGKG